MEDELDEKDNTEQDKKPEAKRMHKKHLLIGRDRWTKTVTAQLVKCKGLGECKIVGKIIKAIDGMGYRKIVIKTHGETGLVAVQEAMACERTHDTICENPLAYEERNGQWRK